MNWIKRKRFGQILKYGWKDAERVSRDNNKNRLFVYLDIVYCFLRYYIFTNQYVKLAGCTEEDKLNEMKRIGNANLERDNWWLDYYENRKFINKYSGYEWETTPKRMITRMKAYQKRYGIGSGTKIQYGVEFSRSHELNGHLSIGNDCLLAKHVFIDYSGKVII